MAKLEDWKFKPSDPAGILQYLVDYLETHKEVRESWLKKQNTISLVAERWEQGYVTALKDLLTLIQTLSSSTRT